MRFNLKYVAFMPQGDLHVVLHAGLYFLFDCFLADAELLFITAVCVPPEPNNHLLVR